MLEYLTMKPSFPMNKTHLILTGALVTITLSGGILLYLSNPLITIGETKELPHKTLPQTSYEPGKHIIVNLDLMNVLLLEGTTTRAVLPILSQGKPGSYYETIGGKYLNDYKTPLHLSTLGHVYMPYSVHIFGNYFIHGIPYYPDGTPVASTYSGGCVRLANEDAKMLYDFTDEGTPIILTRGNVNEFSQTKAGAETFSSMELTALMVATISLETLPQDDPVTTYDGSITTRRNLLPKLLYEGNTSVINLFVAEKGEETFLMLMNQKAQALGLSRTHFLTTTEPVVTTYEDYERFMNYISTYKSYLRTLKVPTS